MAGFLDVLLRGVALVLASLVLGGVAWVRLVADARPGSKPGASVSRALRVVSGAACLAAASQVAVVAVVLGELTDLRGPLVEPLGLLLDTTFARAALVRVALAAIVAVLAARLARHPAGRAGWCALITGAIAFVASSAVLSHAIARVSDRGWSLGLDAVHQLAAATWVGGLAHLAIHAAFDRGDSGPPTSVLVRRFSTMALSAMATLIVAGGGLSLLYVRDLGGLIGTAYGVMVLSKIALVAAALGLAWMNFRLVRRAVVDLSVFRFVEVELGLGVTLLFAAASLTSLPPAVDVREDRATIAEVVHRFAPGPPRLASPPIAELIETAEPLMAGTGKRLAVERAWSEYNHHWAGIFVVVMGVLAGLERAGVRAARHWPLVFLGLAAFLFVRNDPRAWPLGPAGFWESLTLPDVLQHRAFVLLVVAFGVFEWLVRTDRVPRRPWASVFPLLCAVGGGLLLTHSHAMFSLKEEFLTEVTHAPLGLLGAFAGWGRWIELRLPASERVSGWLWTTCLTAVGVLLLCYRES